MMRIEVAADVVRPTGFRLKASFACNADALGLVGPSGCGKSTLLDAIAGIEPGARVVFDGSDCSGLPLETRGVGYITQDALLFPHLSVRENLLYSPRATGLVDVPAALGIESLLDRRPRNLSGGERRRVALGRAILSRPRVLLLDEPFAGLDETRRRDAMSLLESVRRRYSLPMILVSHLADEILGLTDWTIRLDEGRIVASGPTALTLRAREASVDNHLAGTVSGPGRVRIDGVELHAILPENATGRVRLACYAHDVILARSAPEGLSARNVFPVRIASITPVGDEALVQIERPALKALLTAEAVESLGLCDGMDAFAVVKATSIVYLGPA
jgi:molybdate transport system ATP-binding protein